MGITRGGVLTCPQLDRVQAVTAIFKGFPAPRGLMFRSSTARDTPDQMGADAQQFDTRPVAEAL